MRAQDTLAHHLEELENVASRYEERLVRFLISGTAPCLRQTREAAKRRQVVRGRQPS